MRVALGALSTALPYDYPYPRGSFTLANGRQVSDPAVDQPEGDDCLPYICGVYGEDAVHMWCGFWGHSGAKAGCVDPDCAPWRNQISYCGLPQVPASTPYTPPPAPPVTIGAGAPVTTGGAPQSTGAQVGGGPVKAPLAWQVAVAAPIRVKPTLQL